jgi:CHAD domain-containing protein
MAYHYENTEDLADGARRIVREQLDGAIRNLRKPNDEAIHDTRKRIKKTRSVLRLMRGKLGPKRFSSENRALRDAGRSIACARDAYVLMQTLKTLHGPKEIERMLEQDAQRANVKPQAAVGNAGKILNQVRSRIDHWSLGNAAWRDVCAELKQSYGLGRKAYQLARAHTSARNLHEWRKRAKDLWYQLRILRPAWPGVMKQLAKQAEKLSDELGRLNDLAMLEAFVMKNAKNQRELLARIDKERKSLQRAVFALGEKWYAEKPKRFSRRIEDYCLSWQKESRKQSGNGSA